MEEPSKDSELHEMFQELGFECGNPAWQNPDEWIAKDSGDPGYQLLLDTEIVSQVNEDRMQDDESEKEADTMPKVTHAKAHEAFSIALQ